MLQAVPMLYRLLIDVTREDGRTFPSVKHVITTGDKIPATSLEALPGALPQRPLLQHLRLHRDERQPDPRVRGPGRRRRPDATSRSGQPLPGVRTLIRTEDGAFLDGHGHRRAARVDAVPDARLSERGAQRGAGSSPHPDAGHGDTTFYRTGDIVRRHDDGTLTLEGRADFYVKVRGVRVSTQVVEQAIQEHPDVVEVAVVAVPDELAGAAPARRACGASPTAS